MDQEMLHAHLAELRQLAAEDPVACEQKRTEIITAFLASYEPDRRVQLIEMQKQIDHMRTEHEHDPVGFLEKLCVHMITSVQELSGHALRLAHCATLMAMAKQVITSHVFAQKK